MPPKDPVRLAHIIEAARAALRYVRGVAREDLQHDDMRARAVVQAVGVIGEAAFRLAPELRSRYPDVPWNSIAGMRNRLVHEYFAIDYLLVWDTVTDDLPPLVAAWKRSSLPNREPRAENLHVMLPLPDA